MKTNLYTTLLIATFFFLGNAVQAQGGKLQKADLAYQNYAYMNAAEIYSEVVKSGYKTPELLKKLGNTYYFNAQYQNAEKCYTQLFELTDTLAPIYYLRYYQSLNSLEQETKAAKWYALFCEKAGIENTVSYAKKMLLIEENAGRYAIEKMNLGTGAINFGASLHHEALIFASTKDQGEFLDLYKANLVHTTTKTPDSLGAAMKIDGRINTKFHESSACFSKDGKTMYFTRNNNSSELKKSDFKNLKIYRATWKNGKWTNIEDLSINSDQYSNAHPTLSPDGDKLYFASNMPGTLGDTDIFVAPIDENGNLGTPVNLGEKINTIGRETFPFVSAKNELYFSSNGHFGMGGLDVFYVQLKPESKIGFGNILNVGSPINSSKDDLAFGISSTTKKGFFSSNRETKAGKLGSDIYAFFEKAPIIDVKTGFITGVVTDKNTQLPLASVRLSFLNRDNKVIETVFTDSLGRFRFKGKRFKNYLVHAEKNEYDITDKFIKVVHRKNEIDIFMTQNLFLLKPGTNLGKILDIPVVYFGYDKANIDMDATIGLEKIIVALQKYPKLNIEIRSYTDSRGNKNYNLKLSERRAKATVEYIIERGIAKERLSYQGYGESQLLNDCKDGVPCSPEEHQRNRRSAFIVTE